MNPSVERFREATAAVPPQARERVWKRLQAAPQKSAPAWSWLPAGAAAAAVALLAVLAVKFPRAPVPHTPYAGDGFVAVSTAGTLFPRGPALALSRGEVLISSWGTRVEVTAGSHRITTDAAVFAVRVAADRVELYVEEGAVWSDGERVTAARRAGAPDFAPLRAVEPSEAQLERAWALAENAAAQGRTAEAIERFAALAEQSSLRAEAALLRKGQLELWALHAPAAALGTLSTAAARFPGGALQQEVALSRLEALVSLERWADAADQARAFLEAFPDSERRAEVEALLLNTKTRRDIQRQTGP